MLWVLFTTSSRRSGSAPPISTTPTARSSRRRTASPNPTSSCWRSVPGSVVALVEDLALALRQRSRPPALLCSRCGRAPTSRCSDRLLGHRGFSSPRRNEIVSPPATQRALSPRQHLLQLLGAGAGDLTLACRMPLRSRGDRPPPAWKAPDKIQVSLVCATCSGPIWKTQSDL